MSARKASTRRRWPPSPVALDALIEEAITDANGMSEERVGFYTMIEEHLVVPFDVELLGVTVTVERIEMADDQRIVAVCRRGRFRQAVSIMDLPMPARVPPGAEWIAAYRRWARWQ